MSFRTFAWIGAILLVSLALPALGAPATAGQGQSGVSIFWSIPFASLLLAIAVMPFIHRHWWERNYPFVSAGLALLVAIYYFGFAPSTAPWFKEMKEYASFIILLGSLFIVSGGISIRINRKATPLANATLLLIGAVIANIFGTTGAAMLLIRPYLRMNRGHIKPFHIVFFIFIVANIGGSLTPIGDPPLFLGYLKGVPFWWPAQWMFGPWLLATGVLLAIFIAIDLWDHRNEPRQHEGDGGPQVHILGVHNFLFIGIILAGVFRPGVFDAAWEIATGGVTGGRIADLLLSRELLMAAAAIASRALTARVIYDRNEFGFGPIREVAILFVGIFSTMVPALEWLEHNAGEMNIRTPGQFYYSTGTLSAVLDNAPTYLTFLKARLATVEDGDVEAARRILGGMKGKEDLVFDPQLVPGEAVRGAVRAMVRYHDDDVRRGTINEDELRIAFLLGTRELSLFVLAISAGSVFFGACTYIGNGPNFMVKSIADAHGIRTPPFLEYIWKYALPILIPVYVLVWWVFLTG